MLSRILFLVSAVGPCAAVLANYQPAVLLTPDSAYSQDFDGMVASGPTGWGAFSGTSLPAGWSLAQPSHGPGSYRVSDGRRIAPGYYSFGERGSSDRALGTLQHGKSRGRELAFGFELENASALTLEGLQIQFTGEEWRLGAGRQMDRLDFQYSTDATSLTRGTWVDFNSLDVLASRSFWAWPTDGNSAEHQQRVQSFLPVSLAAGETLWIRWLDRGTIGRGAGLAIDDLWVDGIWADSITPVPELGTWSAGAVLAGLALLGGMRRGRRTDEMVAPLGAG